MIHASPIPLYSSSVLRIAPDLSLGLPIAVNPSCLPPSALGYGTPTTSSFTLPPLSHAFFASLRVFFPLSCPLFSFPSILLVYFFPSSTVTFCCGFSHFTYGITSTWRLLSLFPILWSSLGRLRLNSSPLSYVLLLLLLFLLIPN